MGDRLYYTLLGSFIFTVAGLYIIKFGEYPVSDSPQNWGEFGDYFGGVLNPIISFAALIVLIKTIKQNEKALSQNEKALTQNEIALKQNAEELAKTAKAQSDLVNLETEKQKQEKSSNLLNNYLNNIKDELKLFEYELERVKLHNFDDKDSLTLNECITKYYTKTSLRFNPPNNLTEFDQQIQLIEASLFILIYAIENNSLYPINQHPMSNQIKASAARSVIKVIRNLHDFLSKSSFYYHDRHDSVPILNNDRNQFSESLRTQLNILIDLSANCFEK